MAIDVGSVWRFANPGATYKGRLRVKRHLLDDLVTLELLDEHHLHSHVQTWPVTSFENGRFTREEVK